MSGDPPHGFAKHCLGECTENMTDERLAEEIGEWFGSRGVLDMRAYLRFRLLDYFKNRFLPEENSSDVHVSKEEMAMNTLVLDFALRHKYYFTVCLLLSEIQAFSKFDERLAPLMKKMSSMTTEDFENLTPLLDPNEVRTLLETFGIDPGSGGGNKILKSYRDKDKRSSLIELAMSSITSFRKGEDKVDAMSDKSEFSFIQNEQIQILDERIDEVNNQLTDIKLKVQLLECQRICGCEEKCLRRTDVVFKDLSEKYDDVVKEVGRIEDNIQLLTELLDTIRLQGESAMNSCIPYADLALNLKRNLGVLEVSVARMQRRLVSQSRKSKRNAIKRRKRVWLLDKADMMGRVDFGSGFSQKISNVTNEVKSAETQTELSFSVMQELFEKSFESDKCLVSLPVELRVEKDKTFEKSFQNRDASTVTESAQSLFTLQNVVEMADINFDLRETIHRQEERIGYLTARVASLLAQLGIEGPEPMPRTFRDAGINTEQTLQDTEKDRTRPGKCRQQRVVSPLVATVRQAKLELEALKRERRNIEGE